VKDVGHDACPLHCLLQKWMTLWGMKTTSDGAEAILQFRSVYLCDLWHDFRTFRTQREKKDPYAEQNFRTKEQLYEGYIRKAA
jgi:hypothetical protein